MTTTYAFGNLGPGLKQAQKSGSVRLVNWIPTPPLSDDWISKENTDINKQ